MDHTLRHRQGALAHVYRQQQLALGVHGRPHPLRGARQACDGFVLADCAFLECPEHDVQFVELDLRDVEVVEKVARKGPQLVGCFNEPVQHGVRVNLKHPRRASDAQALGQTGDHPHDQLWCHTLAVKERAEGLEKIAFAGETLELTPRTTIGMAVRAQIV
jgi:hypothetical protein